MYLGKEDNFRTIGKLQLWIEELKKLGRDEIDNSYSRSVRHTIICPIYKAIMITSSIPIVDLKP